MFRFSLPIALLLTLVALPCCADPIIDTAAASYPPQVGDIGDFTSITGNTGPNDSNIVDMWKSTTGDQGVTYGDLCTEFTNAGGTAPLNALIFQIDVQEQSQGLDVVYSALSFAFNDTTHGPTTFDLGSETLTIKDYRPGSSGPDALVRVDTTFDVCSAALSSAAIVTSVTDATIGGETNGPDEITFAGGLSAIPEPSAFLLVGLVGSVIAIGRFRQLKSED